MVKKLSVVWCTLLTLNILAMQWNGGATKVYSQIYERAAWFLCRTRQEAHTGKLSANFQGKWVRQPVDSWVGDNGTHTSSSSMAVSVQRPCVIQDNTPLLEFIEHATQYTLHIVYYMWEYWLKQTMSDKKLRRLLSIRYCHRMHKQFPLNFPWLKFTECKHNEWLLQIWRQTDLNWVRNNENFKSRSCLCKVKCLACTIISVLCCALYVVVVILAVKLEQVNW